MLVEGNSGSSGKIMEKQQTCKRYKSEEDSLCRSISLRFYKLWRSCCWYVSWRLCWPACRRRKHPKFSWSCAVASSCAPSSTRVVVPGGGGAWTRSSHRVSNQVNLTLFCVSCQKGWNCVVTYKLLVIFGCRPGAEGHIKVQKEW